MKKDLSTLESEMHTYDKESQNFIKSLTFVDKEISSLNSMKATDGWKILEGKIREELQQRIKELVQPDLKITTLLALLTVADTKSMSKTLDDEIERLIPD